jgi:hypothetical protein
MFVNMNLKKCKGSVTVEAAIVLPIFISVVLTIVFIIKLVYLHEVIQHSINEAANQMAEYSYFYYVSGVQEIQDEVRDGLKSRAQLFNDHADTIIDAYDYLQSVPSKLGESLGGASSDFNTKDPGQIRDSLSQSTQIVDDTKENLNKIKGVLSDVSKNPAEEIKSLVCVFAEGAFENIKTDVCIPVVKYYIGQYLKVDTNKNIDENIKNLNVIKGFEGLDFDQSSFYEDENNNIDIVVRYKVEIPVPFKVFPSLTIVQRSTVKAWLGGEDENKLDEEGLETYDDIWALNNFQRGNKLRSIFGANLPPSFPTLSSFDEAAGKAVMIKSIDLTADSYQDPEELGKTIDSYIKKLSEFEGTEKPWGSKGIMINKNDIKSRELVLIIPKNPVKSEITKIIDDYKLANVPEITIKVEEYGLKKLDK